ncbi:hypothetical protein WN55_03571 [Dufourea novaeangliae]|uniref:Uncharacterized protein n=1 Tax=Dufourea novaeangliae TaxID=178035 RepID=A0A154PIN9_DUFNO|nr:hypothetical protein WN55_03571 [Dufourea novaeangliae]
MKLVPERPRFRPTRDPLLGEASPEVYLPDEGRARNFQQVSNSQRSVFGNSTTLIPTCKTC